MPPSPREVPRRGGWSQSAKRSRNTPSVLALLPSQLHQRGSLRLRTHPKPPSPREVPRRGGGSCSRTCQQLTASRRIRQMPSPSRLCRATSPKGRGKKLSGRRRVLQVRCAFTNSPRLRNTEQCFHPHHQHDSHCRSKYHNMPLLGLLVLAHILRQLAKLQHKIRQPKTECWSRPSSLCFGDTRA